MAPPAAAGGPSASSSGEPEAPHHRDVAKRGRRAGAGARLLSLGVQAAVMAAALALFLLFAAAAAVFLLSLLVSARAFRHHGSRYRVPPDASASSSPPPPLLPSVGLSTADLRLLPCFAYSSCDASSTSSSSPRLCAVCLETARAGERWRALPACGHAFHAACVDRWLVRSPACPVCRAAVAVSVR